MESTAGNIAAKWTDSKLTLGIRARRLLWSVVQATLYRMSFHSMNRWRMLLLRLFGARIDGLCLVRRTSRVYYPWLLKMGTHACLGDGCEIYNLGPVEVGNLVIISQEAYLCAGSHDYNRKGMPLITSPIILRDQCWVCARAFIMPGVTIGEGAIIAAASVVTHDVEPWTIVAGNPAKFVKKREKPAEA